MTILPPPSLTGARAVFRAGTPEEVVVLRQPEHDLDGEEAWRLPSADCTPTSCFHPMHAFNGGRRGIAHLSWFEPGTPLLTPLQ